MLCPLIAVVHARFDYQRSKLDLKNAELTKSLADQTLKNDIYKAYYNASAAYAKIQCIQNIPMK